MGRLDEYNETSRVMEGGVRPTRYKFVADIYSEARFSSEMDFSVDKFHITFTPVEFRGNKNDNDLMFNCSCAAIIEKRPDDPRRALSDALGPLFAMAQSNYSLGAEIDEFVELDGEWMRYPAGHGKGILQFLPDLKRDEEFKQRANVVIAAMRHAPSSKIATKLRECLQLLATGNRLERNWPADAFLSYYRVVEIVGGELHQPWAATVRETSPTIAELVQLDIIGQRTQKMMVYFVCKALNLTDLSLADTTKVATFRNTMAHSSARPDSTLLTNCKQLAYSCFLELSWRIAQQPGPRKDTSRDSQ